MYVHFVIFELQYLIGSHFRKRLHTYYHPWAFLRARKYTDALLIVFQALEHNSQDKLAMLNPSLVCTFFFCIRLLFSFVKKMPYFNY